MTMKKSGPGCSPALPSRLASLLRISDNFRYRGSSWSLIEAVMLVIPTEAKRSGGTCSSGLRDVVRRLTWAQPPSSTFDFPERAKGPRGMVLCETRSSAAVAPDGREFTRSGGDCSACPARWCPRHLTCCSIRFTPMQRGSRLTGNTIIRSIQESSGRVAIRACTSGTHAPARAGRSRPLRAV